MPSTITMAAPWLSPDEVLGTSVEKAQFFVASCIRSVQVEPEMLTDGVKASPGATGSCALV